MIVGRDTELGSVRSLVRAARSGTGGVLAVVGPPGIGKTTLLEAAADDTDGMRVLRVQGVEAERDLPFAGLLTLVAPALESSGALSPVQLRAIAVALGQADGPPPGRMALGSAVLALLTSYAASAPVLVLVDDLQWLDPPSAETLVFAARRLVADPVAVLLGSRPVEANGSEGLGELLRAVPRIDLTGLAPGCAAALLPGVAATVAAELAERTGGNPLALVEVSAALDDDARLGRSRLPRELPVSSAADSYRRTLAGLPDTSRFAAVVLAHAARAPGDLVSLALEKLGLSLFAVAPLEESGLGSLTADGMSWRHPLVRSAAAEATAERTRAAHLALAEAWAAFPGSQAPWAWHMAEAAQGPAPAVAAALADTAEVSLARDAALEAADAWERAAGLADDPELRHAWLCRAGNAAFRGGASARAATLYDLVLDTGYDAPAEVWHERGRIEHVLGRPTRAFELLITAAERAPDSRAAVWAAAEAVFAGMYAQRPDLARTAADLAAARHDAADPVQAFLTAHAGAAATALAGSPQLARQPMAEAMDLLWERDLLSEEPGLLLWAVNADLFVEGPGISALDARVAAVVEQQRAAGELVWSPRVVRLVAVRDEARGRWATAYAGFEDAAELSRMAGQRTQLAEALLGLATIEAVRGERELCEARLEEAAAILRPLEVRWLEQDLERARRLLALTLGEQPDVAQLDPDYPFDVARGRLRVGERLRREGRRVEAREHLRAAEEAFRAMAAGPWLERTRDELRASGATLRSDPSGQELTPSELRVATLVAQGRSNKEVAAALFLSPKTVEFHLGRVYRKLDVSNRTALAAVMATYESGR